MSNYNYVVRQGEFDESSTPHSSQIRGTFQSLNDARKFYNQVKTDTSTAAKEYVYTEVIRVCNGQPPLQFDYFLMRS